MMTEKKQKQMIKIIDAATEWFMSTGYFAARLDKIAGSAGLTSGALYTYFGSKEALFDFVIRKSILNLTPEQWPEIPVATPSPNSTLEFLKNELPKISFIPILTKALETDDCPDPKKELEQIVGNLFDTREKNRIIAIILYMSSFDWPELNEVCQFEIIITKRFLLKRYLEKRISQKLFNTVPDIEYATSVVEGSINLFTINRSLLLAGSEVDLVKARATVIQAVARFLIPG